MKATKNIKINETQLNFLKSFIPFMVTLFLVIIITAFYVNNFMTMHFIWSLSLGVLGVSSFSTLLFLQYMIQKKEEEINSLLIEKNI